MIRKQLGSYARHRMLSLRVDMGLPEDKSLESWRLGPGDGRVMGSFFLLGPVSGFEVGRESWPTGCDWTASRIMFYGDNLQWQLDHLR